MYIPELKILYCYKMLTIIRAFSVIFLLTKGLASMLMAAEGWGGCGNFLKQDNNEVCRID
jgi:hypothetical protein